MEARTLTRPDLIRRQLEQLVPRGGCHGTLRCVGQPMRRTHVHWDPSGRLFASMAEGTPRPRPGGLVQLSLDGTHTSFHAEVWPSHDDRGIGLALPRVLDLPQRRREVRVKSRTLRLTLFASDRLVRTVLVDLSTEGIGFLTGDADVATAEPGTRYSARLDEHGVATTLVVEVVRTDDAPGSRLFHVGTRIAHISDAGRRFLRHRVGAAAQRGAA